MSTLRVPGVAALLLVLHFGASLSAADWPMLGRDATRNAVSPETGAPLDWHPGEFDGLTGARTEKGARNVKWFAKLGTWTAGDPVVAGGLVWVGTNSHSLTEEQREDASVLTCFREHDGALLYKYVSPRLANQRWHDWPHASMTSSPLVEGDRLWFITNRWEVVCLDIGGLASGMGDAKVLWKVDLINELGVFGRAPEMGWLRRCSPAGYKDWIYVITGNGVDQDNKSIPKPDAPSLLCLEKETGKVVWSDSSPGANILQGQWASPLAIEIGGRAQCIAPLGDGWVRSFDAATGQLLWEFDINPKDSTFQHFGDSSRNNLVATPVHYDGRVYIAAGHNPGNFYQGQGRLVCIDPTKTGDISSELAVDAAGNSLPRRRVQAVDASKDERAIPNPNSGLVWEFTRQGDDEFMDAMHRSVTSVAIANGLLIAVDASGLVQCLDAKTGKRHWAYDALSECVSAPLIVDGKVYIPDSDGEVAVLRLSADPTITLKPDLSGDQMHEPFAKINMGGGFYCSPIFANGVLYLATTSHLFAIQETEANEPQEQGQPEDQRQQPAAPNTAAMGEWKQWRGPDRANKSPETGLLQEWPEGGPPLAWRVEGLGQGIASVSVADERIYTSTYSNDTEYILALDQETGRLAWARPIGAAVRESPLMRWLSQRSPTIDDDRLYFLSAEGVLFCLNTEDGSERWRKNYVDDFQGEPGMWGFCDYPLVDGDKLDCAPGGPDATLVALDKLTGEPAWKYAAGTPEPQWAAHSYAATIVWEAAGVRQYVAFTNQAMIGVSAEDGRLLWRHDRHIGRYRFDSITPLVWGDRLFCHSAQGAMLLTLARDGDDVRARQEYSAQVRLNPFQDNLILVGDHVYMESQGFLSCVDLASGELAWETRIALDSAAARTGDASAASRFRRGSAATTYADGRLYLRYSDGEVRLVEPSPAEYINKGVFTIADRRQTQGATTPVIAGGHLYIRDDDRLFAYDVRQNALDAPRPEPKTITIGFPRAPAATQGFGRRGRGGVDRPGPRSVFVPTPQDVVEKMLELAEVKRDDLVYDLGSGDGRIVITAAKEYGSRAIGIEIDAELVGVSRAKAKEAGVGELVTIEQEDIFRTDLSDADVVAVYLLPTQLEKLIPQLGKLPTGARIVSHQFEIPGFKADRTERVTSDEDSAEHTIYLWTSPLKR